jgi:hypothetical protein
MVGKKNGEEKNLFIWFDLQLPAADGGITGTYFYKTVGRPISLYGKEINGKMLLEEKDKKGNTNGMFLLERVNDKLSGIWTNTSKSDSFRINMYMTDTAFRKSAKLPRLNELLSEDIDFYREGLDSAYYDEGVRYQALFAGSDLLSIELNWENYWYTAHYGTLYYTYNLGTHEWVDLKADINALCDSFLVDSIRKIVTENYQMYSDSEWVDGIYSYMNNEEEYDEAVQKVRDLFAVESMPEKACLYLDKFGLNCYIQDYCEQYYSSGNRGMTFDVLITIPYTDLPKYVKPDSLLSKIGFRW